jgi:hypothetical protein
LIGSPFGLHRSHEGGYGTTPGKVEEGALNQEGRQRRGQRCDRRGGLPRRCKLPGGWRRLQRVPAEPDDEEIGEASIELKESGHRIALTKEWLRRGRRRLRPSLWTKGHRGGMRERWRCSSGAKIASKEGVNGDFRLRVCAAVERRSRGKTKGREGGSGHHLEGKEGGGGSGRCTRSKAPAASNGRARWRRPPFREDWAHSGEDWGHRDLDPHAQCRAAVNGFESDSKIQTVYFNSKSFQILTDSKSTFPCSKKLK